MLDRLLSGKPLLDGVLVGAGEGRENEIPDVRVARVDRELGAVFESAGDGVDVGEIEAGMTPCVYMLRASGDEVDVAGALAVAEKAAFDAVGAGHEAEFGGGDGRAAVVVRVEADDDAVAAGEVAVHPLDLVGVDVGRGDFDRGREVEDDLALRRGAPGGSDGIADFEGEIELGGGEEFRAVFEGDSVSGMASASARMSLTASTAMATTSALLMPKTLSRKLLQVAL
jgi:hypothetical protein